MALLFFHTKKQPPALRLFSVVARSLWPGRGPSEHRSGHSGFVKHSTGVIWFSSSQWRCWRLLRKRQALLTVLKGHLSWKFPTHLKEILLKKTNGEVLGVYWKSRVVWYLRYIFPKYDANTPYIECFLKFGCQWHSRSKCWNSNHVLKCWFRKV